MGTLRGRCTSSELWPRPAAAVSVLARRPALRAPLRSSMVALRYPAARAGQTLTDSPQTSIRDYLEILRANRLLVAAAVALAVGASLGRSLNQEERFRATASLIFGDVSQDLALVGAAGTSGELPAARTLRESRTLLRTEVLGDASRALPSHPTVAALRRQVTAKPENTSNLVLVQTEAGSGVQAAAIANAIARAAVSRTTRDRRRSFRAAATDLRNRFSSLPKRDRIDAATRSLYNDRISRLDALASVSTPVKLAEEAEAPTAAFAPRPLRSALVAALLGVLAGVGAAFLRNALDRRLRGPDEIHEHLGLPLLGHVSEDAMGRAGMSHAGRGPLSPTDLEGFRILRANLEFLDKEPSAKVVLVTSCVPGEGKTTVAASLAFASAIAGRRTLLIECDLRRPTLAKRLGLNATPGVVELLRGEAQLEEAIRSVIHVTAHNGDDPTTQSDGPLDVMLAGGTTERPAEILGSPALACCVEDARTRYDMIVIDSPPLLPVVDTLELMRLADAALMCVRVARTTKAQAKAGRDLLSNMKDNPVALVVTGLTRDRGDVYGYYSQAYSYEAT